ncbi:MAG: class I SAM-dependent methyltransferase [Lachnospiraceae bacterium]|nr:class I SAM-dependent methyltransferase [Lachnospiraceae bacterium]
MQNPNIDKGHAFDWGRASKDYAQYRDIYPAGFYQKLLELQIGTSGQKILDLGTGTGVIPRNLYRYGADFTGIDASPEQIEQARRLAMENDMQITFACACAEDVGFPAQTFDVVTACQCFVYFRHEELAPRVYEMLKPNGRFAVMYMAWLPFEDEIASRSESLILKYNPAWTGGKETRRKFSMPKAYEPYFEMETNELFDIPVPFTKESWNGRIKACRGIGASLSEEAIMQFEKEHKMLLDEIAPTEFTVLHYAAIAVMKALPCVG